MKSHLALALLVALVGAPAWSETAPAPAPAAAAADHPWERAQAVLDETNADLAKGAGYDAVRAHLKDLEGALDGADAVVAATGSDKDVVYVLTDGPADTLFSLLAVAAAADKSGVKDTRKTVAVNNPYPAIALYVGSYYNEIGRYDDALRALDRGLALFATQGIGFGQHKPSLLAERAIALVQLKRLAEALAAYDEALAAAGDDDAKAKARMHRGRGYVLTELGRLDEAEAAYRQSLKLEPDNALAKRELDYIYKLRLGVPKAATEIVTPKPPAQQPQDTPETK